LRLQVLQPLKEDTGGEFEVVDHVLFLFLEAVDLLSKVGDLPLLGLNDLLELVVRDCLLSLCCRLGRVFEHVGGVARDS
jgi:hypothetical protein